MCFYEWAELVAALHEAATPAAPEVARGLGAVMGGAAAQTAFLYLCSRTSFRYAMVEFITSGDCDLRRSGSKDATFAATFGAGSSYGTSWSSIFPRTTPCFGGMSRGAVHRGSDTLSCRHSGYPVGQGGSFSRAVSGVPTRIPTAAQNHTKKSYLDICLTTL